MTAPLPYPIGASAAATPLITDALAGWAGFTITGNAPMDAAFQGTTDSHIETAQLAYWENNPAAPQSPANRSGQAAKSYGGLPASSFVTVVVDTAWFLATGVTSFVGMKVAGSPFSPNVGPSGGFVPSVGTTVGYATTDGSGNVVVAFAVDDVHPSFNLNIHFSNLRIYLGFYDPDPFADIIVDSAVLYHMENRPISITRAGAGFAENLVLEEYDFPGKLVGVVGGDEIIGRRAAIRATVMMTGERQFLIYAPGGAWAGSAYGRTYTPAAMRSALGAGVYLTGVRCIWKRLRGDYIQVRFPYALVKSYDISGQDLSEGGLAIEIEARQNLASGTPATNREYFIDILPVGATI